MRLAAGRALPVPMGSYTERHSTLAGLRAERWGRKGKVNIRGTGQKGRGRDIKVGVM